MKQYRKKPVVVNALQFTGDNIKECREFCTKLNSTRCMPPKHVIGTLAGNMEVSVNDFIIKGIQGEFYPCKPDIFWETYETV
jgi:hypothetical protein